MSLVDEMDGPWMSKTISVFGAVRSFVSQLRIGQDMTKLPMPAIFFRPYSLLECLSQRHLAYVDTLSGLTASKDPVERFLSVCAWYLSNQRNELLQFYKKPYNPILCETHECRVSFADKEAKFFAEQVSHHPPVSAVHLAIPSLKLELLCSYSFGVVFSANSVAVTTTGHMEITDNEHGDVYDAPQGMPNLSITNVIWGKRGMYWTGKIAITCEKTALRAVLDFTVDPKTDKNLVSGFIATLKEPETPVAKFSGECGGATEVVYPLTAAARPLFAPAARTKLKIQYPPIEQLAPLSSLKLWAETNKAIVADDMPRADAAKKAVEDAQRARNAQGHVQPAFFTLDAKGVWRLKPDVQPTSIVSGAAPAAAAAAAVAPASPTTEHKKP